MFTYKSYANLIHTGVERGVTFFLRHDVDISLKKAVEMAEFEAKNEFHSTYYILYLVRSITYLKQRTWKESE